MEAAIAAARATLAERIHFDYDMAEIRPDAERILRAKLAILRASPNVMLRIEGHCDERGSNEYNDALGNRRAQAVVDFFTNFGLDASRFAIVSFGEDRPLASQSDEDAWAKTGGLSSSSPPVRTTSTRGAPRRQMMNIVPSLIPGTGLRSGTRVLGDPLAGPGPLGPDPLRVCHKGRHPGRPGRDPGPGDPAAGGAGGALGPEPGGPGHPRAAIRRHLRVPRGHQPTAAGHRAGDPDHSGTPPNEPAVPDDDPGHAGVRAVRGGVPHANRHGARAEPRMWDIVPPEDRAGGPVDMYNTAVDPVQQWVHSARPGGPSSSSSGSIPPTRWRLTPTTIWPTSWSRRNRLG